MKIIHMHEILDMVNNYFKEGYMNEVMCGRIEIVRNKENQWIAKDIADIRYNVESDKLIFQETRNCMSEEESSKLEALVRNIEKKFTGGDNQPKEVIYIKYGSSE